jgi:hypothetical protein
MIEIDGREIVADLVEWMDPMESPLSPEEIGTWRSKREPVSD